MPAPPPSFVVLRGPVHVQVITRLGADNVATVLPPLVAAVRRAGLPVAWLCDPMHGNTTLSPSGEGVMLGLAPVWTPSCAMLCLLLTPPHPHTQPHLHP